MKELKRYTWGLAILFGLPFFLLILLPWFHMKGMAPVPYSEVADEDAPRGESYPPGRSGRYQRGARVYASEGCVYCHTQMVRPTYAGADMWRGWGGREEGGFARETRPRDYSGETYAYLGTKRFGADLSNVGWRRDAAWFHQMLYNPAKVMPYTKKPSYGHLYTRRPVESAPADNAVAVWQHDGETYEAVPTDEAEALVDYLLSLKKDGPVPAALRNGAIADASGDEAPAPATP